MKIAKKIIKWFLYFFLIPTTYIIVSLLLSSITIERKESHSNVKKLIYLNTNGVHLDILIPIENINSFVLSDLKYNKNEKYLSFGWGDENFYINTPTWGDLTFSNAFKKFDINACHTLQTEAFRLDCNKSNAIRIRKTEHLFIKYI